MRIATRLGLLAALLLGLTSCGINAIPTYEEQAAAAWSQVLNQYKRRTDLIPNLVATVQGAADFERGTLNDVVEARASVNQMKLPDDILTNPGAFQQFEQLQGQLGGALSRLLVTVEAYPQIQTSQNFLALQSQIEGTENRIAVARRDYIEAVRLYNTELKTFPGRIWKMILYGTAEPMQTFTVSEEETAVPKVDFGKSSD